MSLGAQELTSAGVTRCLVTI